jgi:hypothetical protein
MFNYSLSLEVLELSRQVGMYCPPDWNVPDAPCIKFYSKIYLIHGR